jgi:predicted nucleotidyltransferase
METPLPQDFKEFLALLNSESVEYLVVGGYAVSYHGYPRPTGDLDIWIAVDISNAQRIRTVLQRFGFAQDRRAPEEFLVPNQVFRMGVPPVRIEVLTGVTGVEFAECYSRRIEADLDGVRIKLIGREDLLANKRAAGRHKDLNDLEHLTGRDDA